MKKQTKAEKAAMLTNLVMYAMDGGTLYTAEDVAKMQDRIKELEAEVALLRDGQPEIPEHENIRGKEYYK